MFKTIVAAIDGSEHSLQALNCAKNLASDYAAKLVVVHAYPHTSDLHAFEGYHKLLTKRKSEGEKILALAKEMIGKSTVNLQETLLEGPAAEAILSVAHTRCADLIVLGTRGMGAVKGLLFGSVATKISHHAPCAVLVVR